MAIKKEFCESCDAVHVTSERDKVLNPNGNILEKGIVDSCISLIHLHAKARPVKEEDLLIETEEIAYINSVAKSYSDVLYYMARTLITSFPENFEFTEHFLKQVLKETEEVQNDVKSILKIIEEEVKNVKFGEDLDRVLH